MNFYIKKNSELPKYRLPVDNASSLYLTIKDSCGDIIVYKEPMTLKDNFFEYKFTNGETANVGEFLIIITDSENNSVIHQNMIVINSISIPNLCC